MLYRNETQATMGVLLASGVRVAVQPGETVADPLPSQLVPGLVLIDAQPEPEPEPVRVARIADAQPLPQPRKRGSK